MDNTTKWKSLADMNVMQRRARLYQQIREFMSAHDVLEVDTPMLSRYGNTDPFIESIQARSVLPEVGQLYLHTSPEFCMKRLLASGSGDIYQITHAYRDGEQGQHHTLEFSMLESYRTDMDYIQFMDEVSELMVFIGLPVPVRKSYTETFAEILALDPLNTSTGTLQKLAIGAGWDGASDDRHELLDFIFSQLIIKQISNTKSLIIYDYPACMAALAKLNEANPHVCERFELFIDGMEIANGFTELRDSNEQRQRFMEDLKKRKQKQMRCPPLDENFLAALAAGLPICSGMAMGLDRLLMVLTGHSDINAVNSFSLNNN